MYADSIKERQQELLDVLFKKASGRFEFEEAEGAGVSTDPEIEQLNRLLNEAARLPTKPVKKKKSPILTLEKVEIPQPETGNFDTPWFPVVKNRPIRSIDDVLTELPEPGTPNPFAVEQTQITEPEKPKVSKPNWSAIKRVAGNQIRKMTGVDAIRGMYDRAHDGVSSAIAGVRQNLTTPAGSQPAPTNPETPTSSAPEGEGAASPETPTTPEGGGPTPSTQKPKALVEAEQAAEKAKKDGQPPAKRAELDWNKVLKGLIEKLKRHKITGIGGLGGFGLGALIGGGGSFTDRLLWALLGGGAGTGLGYLVEKYLK